MDSNCCHASATIGLLVLTFNRQQRISGLHCTHWWGSPGCRSYVTRTRCSISLASSNVGGHPGEWHLHDSTTREYYCPHIVSNVNTTVWDCVSAPETSRRICIDAPYNWFQRVANWNFVERNTLRPLPKTFNSSQYVLVMTDRNYKLTRAVFTSKTTGSHIVSLFMHKWTMPWGIPTTGLTENLVQSVSKFFELLCAFLGSKHLRTMAYHLEMNWLAEQMDTNIIARLQHYLTHHQRDGDMYVQLTYSYKAQVLRDTNKPLFSVVLSRHPHGPTKLDSTTALLTDVPETIPPHVLRARLLLRVATMRQDAEKLVQSSQRQ